MKVDMKFGSGSTNDAAKDIASSTEAYAHLKPTNFRELLTAKALQHKEGYGRQIFCCKREKHQ